MVSQLSLRIRSKVSMNLTCDGDSIVAGDGVLGGLGSYTDRYRLGTTSRRLTYHNFALGGATVNSNAPNNLYSRAFSVDATLIVGQLNVLYIGILINDLVNHGMTTPMSDYATYLDARRAAGWNYIIIGTMMPGSASMSSYGGLTGNPPFANDEMDQYNNTLKSWAGSHCDATLDLNAYINTLAISLGYPNGDAMPDGDTGGIYFQQTGTKVHPTAALDQLICDNAFRPLLNGL